MVRWLTATAQTDGRGRLGRRWSSPSGRDLYVSVIVRPGLAPTGFGCGVAGGRGRSARGLAGAVRRTLVRQAHASSGPTTCCSTGASSRICVRALAWTRGRAGDRVRHQRAPRARRVRAGLAQARDQPRAQSSSRSIDVDARRSWPRCSPSSSATSSASLPVGSRRSARRYEPHCLVTRRDDRGRGARRTAVRGDRREPR